MRRAVNYGFPARRPTPECPRHRRTVSRTVRPLRKAESRQANSEWERTRRTTDHNLIRAIRGFLILTTDGTAHTDL